MKGSIRNVDPGSNAKPHTVPCGNLTSQDRPWMRALEMQFAAIAMHRKARELALPPSVADDAVFRYLHRCTPFSWSAEPVQAVWAASQSVPLDVAVGSDLMPDGVQACWWWFDSPLPIPMTNTSGRDDDVTKAIHGLMVVNLESEMVVCDCRAASDTPPVLTGLLVFPTGHTLQDLLEGDSIDPVTANVGKNTTRARQLLRFIAAASAWLRQRVVVSSSGHVERHRRKQLEREHDAPVPSDVKVITLRRAETGLRIGQHDGEPIDWSCRWIVNGHWRNQPYADGTHKLIYILPFVKGPADKPLRVPTHTVYQVSR